MAKYAMNARILNPKEVRRYAEQQQGVLNRIIAKKEARVEELRTEILEHREKISGFRDLEIKTIPLPSVD